MTWAYVVVGLAVVFAVLRAALRMRNTISGAGDLWSVPIPRTLDGGPLAMGTRLDIAAALKKTGVPIEELRPLIDRGDDAELLHRYWAARDTARS